MKNDTVAQIVYEIIEDMRGRSGGDHWYDSADEKTQDEIQDVWSEIITRLGYKEIFALRARVAQLEGALGKIKVGPGNRLGCWVLTWACEVATRSLATQSPALDAVRKAQHEFAKWNTAWANRALAALDAAFGKAPS